MDDSNEIITLSPGANDTSSLPPLDLEDLPAIMQALKSINYRGVISLEFEKSPADPHPGISESITYLRSL